MQGNEIVIHRNILDTIANHGERNELEIDTTTKFNAWNKKQCVPLFLSDSEHLEKLIDFIMNNGKSDITLGHIYTVI